MKPATLAHCRAEVLRSIWPDRASRPDASEYLSMTVSKSVRGLWRECRLQSSRAPLPFQPQVSNCGVRRDPYDARTAVGADSEFFRAWIGAFFDSGDFAMNRFAIRSTMFAIIACGGLLLAGCDKVKGTYTNS